MIGSRNVRAGLALLALSLAGGLAMSLYSFEPLVRVPAGLASYDDLPRRLLRLAHVAAVMLPLLNVVLGPVIDRLRLPERAKAWASGLLLAGAAGLPLALALEAASGRVRGLHLAAPPAVATVVGAWIVAWGSFRTPPADLVGRDAAVRTAVRPSFSGSVSRDDIESPRDHLPGPSAHAQVGGGLGGHPRRGP